MNEPANNRWRGHVNSLTARILEEAGYKTNLDFAPLKIKELLSFASLSEYDVENLLCGLYSEENRWRELIGHEPNYNISNDELKSTVQKICENAGYHEHPEWLTNISIGEFLELEGLDEVTIPDMLSLFNNPNDVSSISDSAWEDIDTFLADLSSLESGKNVDSGEAEDDPWANEADNCASDITLR